MITRFKQLQREGASSNRRELSSLKIVTDVFSPAIPSHHLLFDRAVAITISNHFEPFRTVQTLFGMHDLIASNLCQLSFKGASLRLDLFDLFFFFNRKIIYPVKKFVS